PGSRPSTASATATPTRSSRTRSPRTGPTDMADGSVTITHHPELSEFVATEADGREVGVLQYVLTGPSLDIRPTVVPRAAGGRGIGSQLVRAALDHAAHERLTIIPTCSFVPSVLARHPEYRELVAR